MRLHAKANPTAETDVGLSATLIAWGEMGAPHDDTGRTYDVVIEPGGMVPSDQMLAFDGHRVDGQADIIGRVASITGDDTGLDAEIETWSLVAAERVRELGRHLPLSVSAEFAGDNAPGDDGVIRFTASNPATLTGVAVLDPLAAGAFPSARVTKVASLKEQTMPETLTAEPEAATPAAELAFAAELRAEMAEEIRKGLAAAAPGPGAPPHPLARYASFTELRDAQADTKDTELSATFAAGYRLHTERRRAVQLFGALQNQIIPDNPGVTPPSWLTEIYGIIDRGRRVIGALGGPRSAGDSGMTLSYPYTNVDIATIVAEQLAEKTAIHSVKTPILEGTIALATYAGGSDCSLQLLRRSQPSFLAAYERILQAGYNLTTDTVTADTLVADGTGYVAWTPATAVGEDSAKAVIQASVLVDQATGSPATTVLAGTNAFTSLAVAFWSHAPAYGTQNTGGTSQASTLRVTVSGLDVTYAPGMDTDTAVVTNGEAAGFWEDGPFLISAVDVELLGQDTAVWGIGGAAAVVPSGVVILAATPPVAGDAASAGKSSKK